MISVRGGSMKTALSDEALAERAQDGDVWAEGELVGRYWGIADMIAGEFNVPGMATREGREDKHSEALAGLVKAIRSYQAGKGAKFKSYAKTVMRRRLTDVYREANRAREVPRNLLRSADADMDGDGRTLGDSLGVAPRVEDAAWADDLKRIVGDGQLRDLLDVAAHGAPAFRPGPFLRTVRAFAGDLLASGHLSVDLHADLLASLSGRQMGLFGAQLSGVSERELAERVYEAYLPLQWGVLRDLAEGFDRREIAARRGIRPETVVLILEAVRESAGAVAA